MFFAACERPASALQPERAPKFTPSVPCRHG